MIILKIGDFQADYLFFRNFIKRKQITQKYQNTTKINPIYMSFHKNLIGLQDAVALAIKNNIDLNKKLDIEKAVYDYSEKQKIYYLNNLTSKVKLVKSDSLELPKLLKVDIRNEPFVTKLLELVAELDSKDLINLSRTVKKMIELAKQINFPKENIEKTFSFKGHIPEDVRAEILADINELNKCYNNDCLRSSVILCGRLLETALHRKYFEVTGQDLLEKAPGIGLGNIIAKLKEKNVTLDPALTNQIHLINQVRVFSVHKKKEAFRPSKEQTHAIILYTLDSLEKLF
jgi:hypothetical protein